MRAVKTILSTSILLTLLSCSLCGCNSEKGTTQFTRTDITTLENIPKETDTLALIPGVERTAPPNHWIFSSGASFDESYQCLIDSHLFLLAKDSDGIVKFVMTEDTTLITPEGIYVGMPIGKASELANSEIFCEPGWACLVQLPCGWIAAIMYVSEDRKIISPDVEIQFLFNRYRAY